MRALLSALILLSPLSVIAQDVVEAPPMSVTVVPDGIDETPYPEELEALDAALPDALFSAKLLFDEGIELQAIRDIVRQLQIPRLMAMVDIGRGQTRPVPMGTFYDGDTGWNYGVCQILVIQTLVQPNALQDVPPEEWYSRELTFYGSAFALRELLADAYLPAARITRLTLQSRTHLERFRDAVRGQIEQPIRYPAGFERPAACRAFSQPVDAPVLTGGYERPPGPLPGLSPAETVRQQLSLLPPDTVVTLQLRVLPDAGVDSVAALVERYSIDGLIMELSPAGNDRIGYEFVFSVHGIPIAEQLRFSRCALELGAAKYPDASAPWIGGDARASLTVAGAWQLLDDAMVLGATLESVYKPGELSRLEAYYASPERWTLGVHDAGRMPPACEVFLQRDQPA